MPGHHQGNKAKSTKWKANIISCNEQGHKIKKKINSKGKFGLRHEVSTLACGPIEEHISDIQMTEFDGN